MKIKGRGAGGNTPNRFEKVYCTPDADVTQVSEEEIFPSPRTQFLDDHTRTILTENNSPDIGFRYSINPYRGCEHGCVYCYARPTHEYLGLSAGIDFETKIFVKHKAPELLRERLMAPSWKPETISLSGVTDCYQPAERKFELTRRCIEVLRDFRNPFGVITKNYLVTRDIELFKEMAAINGVTVFLTMTTLDPDLCGTLEPRTSRPAMRLRALEELSKAGIPTGVNVAPVIPGLTDHELPAILEAAANAGATQAGYVPLRLPGNVLPLFVEWLEQNKPERKDRVLNHIRSIRGGELYKSDFGTRMRGEGPFAEHIAKTFEVFSRKFGFNQRDWELSTEHFERPGQLSLF
ncbi:MAG: PA0069 family radical SAM protein [Bdellovibrionia bacterium]